MTDTLDTSHFEMSELNASAPLNAAESKKVKREKQRGEVDLVRKFWSKKRRRRGEMGGERA